MKIGNIRKDKRDTATVFQPELQTKTQTSSWYSQGLATAPTLKHLYQIQSISSTSIFHQSWRRKFESISDLPMWAADPVHYSLTISIALNSFRSFSLHNFVHRVIRILTGPTCDVTRHYVRNYIRFLTTTCPVSYNYSQCKLDILLINAPIRLLVVSTVKWANTTLPRCTNRSHYTSDRHSTFVSWTRNSYVPHKQRPCDLRAAQQARVRLHDELYIGWALSNARVAVNVY
jgi:hypothetical protein